MALNIFFWKLRGNLLWAAIQCIFMFCKGQYRTRYGFQLPANNNALSNDLSNNSAVSGWMIRESASSMQNISMAPETSDRQKK